MNAISIPLCCDIVPRPFIRFSALVELEIVHRDRCNDAPRLLPLIALDAADTHNALFTDKKNQQTNQSESD